MIDPTPVPRLDMRGIRKQFGDIVAEDDVDFVVEAGEIHALVGENGAGKTTLMNILAGIVRPDAGNIYLDGSLAKIGSSLDAVRYGIGMVHQHFMLVPSLTVAENIFLGRETTRRQLIDIPRLIRGTDELAGHYGLEVPAAASVRDLSVGQRQRVEILKALSRSATLLILDEPTAVLTPQETDELFRVVRDLRAGGKTVIFITHKLNEVKEVAERFTVMRDGRKVATVPVGEASEADIARLMVGREVLFRITKPPSMTADVVLEVEHVTARGLGNVHALDDVSLQVRGGEIVGVAGVEGNGQRELAEIVAGIRRPVAGRVLLKSRDITRATVDRRREAGLGVVPDDRLLRGVSAAMTVAENLAPGHYRRQGLSRAGIIRPNRLTAWTRELIGRFDIRGATPNTSVGQLSGGNIQKVVIAREVSLEPAAMLASQPTRGLDVAATEYVRRMLLDARARGAAVLLISSELSEILSLSDRVLVLFRGKIAAEFSSADASEDEVGLAMMGLYAGEAA